MLELPLGAFVVLFFSTLVHDLFGTSLLFRSSFLSVLYHLSLAWYIVRRTRRWYDELVIDIDGYVVKSAHLTRRVSVCEVASSSIDLADTGREDVVSVESDSVPRWPPDDTLGPSPLTSLQFGCPPAGSNQFWSREKYASIKVRAMNYSSTRKKVSSDFPIYECVGVDVVRSNKVISNLSKNSLVSDYFQGHPSWTSQWSASLGVPRVLIINGQFPYAAPSLWSPQNSETDPGFSLVSYYVLNPLAIDRLNSLPGVNLLRKLVTVGSSTKEGPTLKAIGQVEDFDLLGLPDIVGRYNGKPVLLTKSCKIHKGDERNEFLEIEFDFRMWNFLARKTLNSLQGRIQDAKVSLAFLMEGRSDDELPEQVLGCFKLNYVDISQAVEI